MKLNLKDSVLDEKGKEEFLEKVGQYTHASALQTNTMKFKQDFIGPLFIDTTLDKTHYRLKDATGLLLDGTYHVNRIKKGSACTPLGIVDKFDTYKTGSKELNYLPGTIMDYASLQS